MLLTGCLVQARLVCSRDRAWNEVRIPADMGVDCGHYKWYQNQSIVELAFPVPENRAAQRGIEALSTRC